MTSLPHHPAYLQIADRLDAVGQKYRGQRIARGALIWLATAIAATWSAALVAHWLGSASDGRSPWTWAVLVAWAMAIVAATFAWILRPLLIRPGAVEVARLLESRVDKQAMLDQVVGEAVPGRYSEAVASSDDQPLGQPEIEVTNKEYGQDLTFTAEVDIRPEIELMRRWQSACSSPESHDKRGYACGVPVRACTTSCVSCARVWWG